MAESVAAPRSRRFGDTADTRRQILQEAEALLRRFGPAKLTVTDIAAACGMSHSNLYRFFPSKAAIYGALAEAWFRDVEAALEQIAAAPGDAAQRLQDYVLAMLRLKRQKAAADRALFAAYLNAAEECRDVVARHVGQLRAALRRIVAEGMTEGRFAAADPEATVSAIEAATWRFRHPMPILQHLDEPEEARAAQVVQLLLRGLQPAAQSSGSRVTD